jgi:hypothetical protein
MELSKIALQVAVKIASSNIALEEVSEPLN